MPTVKNVGEPCAGEPHARFEVAAGGNQASRASTCRGAQAPLADPTKPCYAECLVMPSGACTDRVVPAQGKTDDHGTRHNHRPPGASSPVEWLAARRRRLCGAGRESLRGVGSKRSLGMGFAAQALVDAERSCCQGVCDLRSRRLRAPSKRVRLMPSGSAPRIALSRANGAALRSTRHYWGHGITWEERSPPPGRDGRVGVVSSRTMAVRARNTAGRPVVLRDRRTHARARLVGWRRKAAAAPDRA